MRWVLRVALGLGAAAAACLPFTNTELQNSPFFCRQDTDCPSGRVCAMPDGGLTPVCSDRRIRCYNDGFDPDAGETDQNCGGDCPKCGEGLGCAKDSDCLSGRCAPDHAGTLRCIPQCLTECEPGKHCLGGKCVLPKCTCTADYCEPTNCIQSLESCNRQDESCRWACSNTGDCPDPYLVCQTDHGEPVADGGSGYCMPVPTGACGMAQIGFVCGTAGQDWGFMKCKDGLPSCEPFHPPDAGL